MAHNMSDTAEREPLLPDDASTLGPRTPSTISTHSRHRYGSERQREIARYASFASAILSSLCAGSLTAYSLYGHLFQERLRYTQLQVNIVIIAAELAMYLPVSLFGYLCDRIGPAPLSLFAGLTFGVGYVIAAFTYRSGTTQLGELGRERGWPFSIMVVAFVIIGMATVAMYLSAVTTCAKNFGRGKYRGLALATPIATFGLSGLWQSQVGSRLLYETNPDGSRGDVDVFKFFMFLAGMLCGAGVIGTFVLKVVDEEELIDVAVEQIEASGLLEDSAFFHRNAPHTNFGSLARSESQLIRDEAEGARLREAEAKLQEEEDARKKAWLLNGETKRFLTDHTMWWLAVGLFLVSGPGDTFINNLGTIIGTLYPPSVDPSLNPTNAATHVSIVAVTSTVARLVTGTVTDLLAPGVPVAYHRISLENSIQSLPPRRAFAVSRVVFLLVFAIILSFGQVLLASGAIQNHAERFWMVSALIGSGYGAVFSLTPIVISVIWGVENFGTNWGIVAMIPALGPTVWGVVYSWVYEHAANQTYTDDVTVTTSTADILCYGKACYAPTFWAMSVSVWIACGMWLWAWKGRDGWTRRGIAV